ncbi:MAG: PDZ domain-containing protein [Bryobacteraceae bacterium]
MLWFIRIPVASCLLAIVCGATAFAQARPSVTKPVARSLADPRHRSFLGVGVREIDAERAKALKVREERGVEILNVEEQSAAARAGLLPGDAVLEFNGQPVDGVEQFIRLVRETPAGRNVKLLIWRNGAALNVSAEMGQKLRPVVELAEVPFAVIPKPPEVRIIDAPRTVLCWQSSALGIESEALSQQLAEYFGVREGVLIRSVTRASIADKAGLRAGDVVVRADDRRIAKPQDIADLLRSPRHKRSLALSIVRDRRELSLTLVLEDDSSGSRLPFFNQARA